MTANNGKLFARYAVESNKITRNNIVRPKLFEPTKKGTLSVQKIDDLKKDEIHKIGKEVAEKRDKSTVYGWAETSSWVFEKQKLKLFIDNYPRPGHTTISDWPEDRDKRLDIQKELAVASLGVLV